MSRSKINWYAVFVNDPKILGDIAVTAIEKGKTKKHSKKSEKEDKSGG